jgi:hypothetical protein
MYFSRDIFDGLVGHVQKLNINLTKSAYNENEVKLSRAYDTCLADMYPP